MANIRTKPHSKQGILAPSPSSKITAFVDAVRGAQIVTFSKGFSLTEGTNVLMMRVHFSAWYLPKLPQGAFSAKRQVLLGAWWKASKWFYSPSRYK
ncbi:hypothetical protein [Grimontia sp. NTOU-MAR1]|uniref:hypothetical protein n=1 Tax=Grimontia sp. NTOU-MAR1 TaxID=3111011 RepID=UPI002DBA52FC|nr:hypothetical protein [Grimontia sp. NTOU-MAR1]WRV98770.1 hypothetical protein VP504_04910 [Grimontia sp. NTOU-MAR1]